VALLDTKAELVYVLAYEAAHIYRGHYKTQVMLEMATDEYAAKVKANREAVVRRFTLIGSLAGAGIGAGVGATRDQTAGMAAVGATLGDAAGYVAARLASQSRPLIVDWNRFEEDDADQTAFEWTLTANQNVNDVPSVYVALQDAGDHDDRITLGFLGRGDRVRERARKVSELLETEKKKADFSKRTFESRDADFDRLLAEVKRDNGVLAYHHDMLDVARDNLQKAVAVKTQDPTALYYYGKILKETARTDQERAQAQEYFRRAAENDHRNINFGANLHRAVARARPDATDSEKSQASELLKRYLEDYFRAALEEQQTKESYPPLLEVIYDYLGSLGDFRWVLDTEKLRVEAQKQASAMPQMAGPPREAPAPVVPVKRPAAPKKNQ
jgi:hypothetical protein